MPKPDETAAPTATGTLDRIPFANLLAYTMERKMTGTLELSAPSGKTATIVFREGWPSNAKTSEPAYLGGILLGLGLIDDAQLNASLAKMAQDRMLHGRILLAMGALRAEGLITGLRAQLARRLEIVFGYEPETTFAYYDGVDKLASWGGIEQVRVDPLPLLWTSVRTAPSSKHVKEALARVEHGVLVGVVPGVPVERLGLTGKELELVQLWRHRPMTLRQLEALNVLSASSIRLLLYCMMITKFVTLTAQAPTATTPVSAIPPAPASSRSPVAAAMASAPPGGASIPAAPPSASRIPAAPSSSRFPVTAPSSSSRFPIATAVDPIPPPPPSGRGLIPQPPPSSPSMRTTAISTPGAPISPRPVSSMPVAMRTPSSTSIPALNGGSAEHAEQRRRIIERAAVIGSEDYFAVLDLSRDATSQTAQQKYLALVKTWHPDRLPPQLVDVRDLAERIFTRMTEAHATLADPDKRAAYARSLAQGKSATTASHDPILDYQKAEFFLKKKDHQSALEHAKIAHEAQPSNAKFLALYTWIRGQGVENVDEIRKLIEQLDNAVVLEERCESAYFYRAMLYKRLGKDDRAFIDFKNAAEINPRNVDAVREVRLYRMRNGGKSVK